MYSGQYKGAGEIGSLPYLDSDYEHYCSSFFFKKRHSTGADFAKRALAGDAEAQEVWSVFGTHLGNLMKVVLFTYAPQAIVLGGGIVGTNAAQIAAGMGAEVMITDINLARLRYLSEIMPKNVKTLYSSMHNIVTELPNIDLVIGSVLIPGDKAPHLITKDMLKLMKPGTVLVDVAIDQGGCFETSHPTTHSDPTYIVDGIVHYAVANIPGAVPFTSTMALTNATLPYTVALANKGWKQACKEDPSLALGLNIVEGKVTYKAVADVFGLKYETIEL